MVIVGGYETFVSRLTLQGHPDEPEWLSHVNASVLKIKLAMAIIGISSIHLCAPSSRRAALASGKSTYTETGVMWQTIIHTVFILSAIGIALVDKLSNDSDRRRQSSRTRIDRGASMVQLIRCRDKACDTDIKGERHTARRCTAANRLLDLTFLRALAFGLSAGILTTLVSPARAADAAFTQFIASLWPEAQAAGVSRETFDRETRGLEPDYKLPDLILPGRPKTGAPAQAEFVQVPADYVEEASIARLATEAAKLLQKYRAVARPDREALRRAGHRSCWRSGAARPTTAAMRCPTTRCAWWRRRPMSAAARISTATSSSSR